MTDEITYPAIEYNHIFRKSKLKGFLEFEEEVVVNRAYQVREKLILQICHYV